MKKQLLSVALSAGLFLGAAGQAGAMNQTQTTQNRTTQNRHYVQRSTSTTHKRHMKTAKRVGVSAAGGAAVGALVGGGKGAAIGAAAGAGGGALYDRHKKRKGQ